MPIGGAQSVADIENYGRPWVATVDNLSTVVRDRAYNEIWVRAADRSIEHIGGNGDFVVVSYDNVGVEVFRQTIGGGSVGRFKDGGAAFLGLSVRDDLFAYIDSYTVYIREFPATSSGSTFPLAETLDFGYNNIRDVELTDDYLFVADGSDDVIQVYDTADYSNVATLSIGGDGDSPVASDGEHVICADANGDAEVYEVGTWNRQSDYTAPSDKVEDINACGRAGEFILGGRDDTAYVAEYDGGMTTLTTFTAHSGSGEVRHVATEDGRYVYHSTTTDAAYVYRDDGGTYSNVFSTSADQGVGFLRYLGK